MEQVESDNHDNPDNHDNHDNHNNHDNPDNPDNHELIEPEPSAAYRMFIQDIAKGRRFNFFYRQIITLRADILIAVKDGKQKDVAKDLNINVVKMSAIVAMLREMDSPEYHVSDRYA